LNNVSSGLKPTPAMLAGAYSEAHRAVNSGAKENIIASLKSKLSEDMKRTLAAPAERLLADVAVLATDRQVTAARLLDEPSPDGNGRTYSMELDITQDARDRLWQYTYRHPKCQLLLVSNGVAIAAPFVKQEMKYSTITITNVADGDLAKQAIDFIRSRPSGKP
jgi:hypothetical protein